jgi:hypothetical protein
MDLSMFIDAEDDENLIFRKVRGNIEIGICPMMYSFRIRAGVVGEGHCWIDYDAGKSVKEIEDVYSLALSIINQRMNLPGQSENKQERAYNIFKDFPRQERKPMALDHECFMKLSDLCGPEVMSIYKLNIKEELQVRKIKWAITTEGANNNPDFIAAMERMGFFEED